MSERKCFSCLLETSQQNLNSTASEEPEPTFDAVKRIWKEKMNQSSHFLPMEIDDILTVWIKFIRGLIAYLPNDIDAEEFYIEAAEAAARKFKYFNVHGWDCLNMEFPIEDTICSQESLVVRVDIHDDIPVSKNTEVVPKTSSTESISEALGQVDFLLKLVASSNFNLILVKTALDSSFEPNYIKMKYPYTFCMPKMYLELNSEELEQPQTRENLLNGVYNEYILPLQLSNEVNEELWDKFGYY